MKTQREPDDYEKEEADHAAANISKILSARTLDFSTAGYVSLHRRIFEGVFRTVMVGVVCFVPSPLWFLPSESITGRFIPSSSSTCLSTAFLAKYYYLITWKRE